MNDQNKTKNQLIQELQELRDYVLRLEVENNRIKNDGLEKNKIKGQIHQYESSLQALLNASADTAFLMEPDGTIVECNDVLCQRFKIQKENAIGMNIYSFFNSDVALNRSQVVEKVMETGKSVRFIDKRAGFIVENTIYPVFDEKNNVVRLAIYARDITEEKQAENALRESEEKYRRIVDIANEGIWIINGNCITTYVNKQMASLLGFSVDEMLGVHVNEFVIKEELEAQSLRLKERAKGKSGQYESRFRHKNGGLLWFSVSATPLFDGDGKFAGSFAMFTDITERKFTEKALQESEDRYRALFETAPDAIFVADPKSGILIDANYSAEILTGYTRAELIGKHQSFLHPADKGSLYKQQFKDAVNRKGSKFLEVDVLHKDGRKIPVEISSGGIVKKNGESVHFGIFRDITERKQNENSLKESESRFKAVYENSPVGIALVDMSGKAFAVNSALQKILGYSETEMNARNYSDFMHPDDFYEGFESLVKLIDGKIISTRLEKRYINKSGKIIWANVNLSLIRDEQGKPKYIIEMLEDYTQRKQMEDDLLFQAKLLNNIHDGIIATDLNGIINYVNEAECRMLGKSRETLICSSINVLGDNPEKGATQKEIFEKTIQNGNWRGEVVNYTAKGEEILWDCRIELILDNTKVPIGMVGISTNITEQKRMEEALRKNDQLLQETQRISRLGGWEYDVEKGVNNWTQQMYEIYKVPLDFEINNLDKLLSFFPEPDRSLIIESFQNAVNNGERYDLETNFINAEGEYLWVRNIARPIMKNGKVKKIQGSFLDITERKKAQEELETVFNMSLNLICIADINTATFTRINPAFSKLLGYSQKELLGQPFLNFIHPDDLKSTEDVLIKELKRGVEVITFENRYRCKDGSYRWLDWSSKPVPEKGLTFAVAHDITERKIAEEKLRESELKFRTYVESSPTAIFIVDRTGKYQFVNKAACDMMGYARTKLLTMSIAELAHPDEFEKSLSTFPDLIRKGRIHTEILMKRKDNSKVHTILNAVQLSENNYIGFCEDISERKRIEQQLETNVHFLEILLDTIPNPIFYKNCMGKYIGCNNAFANKIIGLPKEEIIGRKVVEFSGKLTGELTEVYQRKDQELVSQPGTQIYETQVHCSDGHLRDFALYKATYNDFSGNIAGLVGVMVDTTELKTLEQQLRHSQKMEAIGTLAGGIAHDFNNLLTAILGNAEFVLSSLSPDNPMQDDVLEIQKAARRAAALTYQLLAFSRRQPLQKKVLNLNNIVMNVQKMINRLIGEDIHLHLNLENQLSSIYADPHQMEQIIINLAVNARDAMPEGGELVLTTLNVNLKSGELPKNKEVKPGGFVCLTIEDTGVGITPKIIDQIFDPFFTTKGLGSGTGLGLSVVHGIVAQHNGWIDVNSEVGTGTIFKAYIPIITGDSEKETLENVAQRSLQGKGERILLVEDESGVREFLRKLLSAKNYVIFSAANANEALKLLEKENSEFDLVFSDVVLPDMNGLALVEKIVEINPNIKIVLSSGYLDEKSQLSHIHEKGFTFLQKPYDIGRLFKTIDNVLK